MSNLPKDSLLRLLHAVLDIAHAGFLITDHSGHILFQNTKAASLQERIGTDKLESTLHSLASQPGVKHQYTQAFIGPNRCFINLAITLKKLDADKLFIWSLVDQSEKIEAEAEIKKQKERANQAEKLAAIGELSSSIVHEIRNPLSIIQGHSHILLEYFDKLNEPVHPLIKNSAQRIRRSAERIEATAQSLLKLARKTDSDPLELVSVRDLFADTQFFSQMPMKGGQVKVEFLDFEGDFKVACRPTEITQALLNLIKNAREEVEHQHEPWVRVSAERDGDRILLRVTDSGLGIDESLKEKIFEPYFTTKEVGKGTGLGLAIVKRIVEEAHHGVFYVDSKSTHTSFVMELSQSLKSDQSPNSAENKNSSGEQKKAQ